GLEQPVFHDMHGGTPIGNFMLKENRGSRRQHPDSAAVPRLAADVPVRSVLRARLRSLSSGGVRTLMFDARRKFFLILSGARALSLAKGRGRRRRTRDPIAALHRQPASFDCRLRSRALRARTRRGTPRPLALRVAPKGTAAKS